jgi:FAD/FMN-containing dehydrogenase
MTVDRRRFLQLAATGTVAAMAGTTAAADPTSLRQSDWTTLRKRLTGDLVLPGDSDYAQDRLGYFTMYDDQLPAAIAECVGTADVQACVETAASTGCVVAARSGGHSYAGYSLPDNGLVADLSRMNSIDVRPDGTAVVGAGARLIDVYTTLAKAGRLLAAGSCPSVGIGGLTLGGGISVIGRQYGLTCDQLISTRIVTADGTVRTASPDSEPDLFWALRGGGGGNFDIVTSFTFRTAPAQDISVFTLIFPPAAATSMVAAWQDWQIGTADELWSQCGLGTGAEPYCQVAGTLVGPVNRLRPMLDDLVRGVGRQPTSTDIQELSFFDAMTYFAECGDPMTGSCTPSWNGAGGSLERGSYVATSRLITKPIRDPRWLVDLLTDAPDGMFTLIDSFGGAIGRVAPHESAFPYRKALGSIQLTNDVDSSEGAARQAIGVIRDELADEFGQTGYVNYIDATMPNWAQTYYGTNLPRLLQVARRYDPHRVFRFAQGLTTLT